MILVIGYGNTLRGDDGVGCVVAQMLDMRLERSDISILVAHQLTPELVASIAEVSSVVFIDAREGDSAGTLRIEAVLPHLREDAFTHNVDPAGLMGAAHDWYSADVKGWLISITGIAFDYADRLSPQLTALLPQIVRDVEQFILMNVSTGEK